ncbi:superfamily II DNA or RNA helicase/HKD family nuclease [Virgibacillus natechei]|uniref:Superfamily II DNA or RNA helicase/HKD family nuclease n=1 Tax=Virgibacillus natechei TaxID=1216297 RepID=A0ABS4IGY8_9BACI|nr:DEAD/DEAH box helicase [Virgibacillus natechei]MBP1970207.1 superfamily II DNA or RNA helicase/HKD family nuclease [Virgibacillus natechei]UZD12842.1 DEAD/DEAH box helicase [Virgibacillus natechei]
MENFIQNLEASLHKGFIDQKYKESSRFSPKLLVNDTKQNENVLNPLLEELETSKSFIFSVAFITESGLATLKSHFLDLKKRGIHGRILTSTFLNFNQPKVFKELMKITNVEVRLADMQGFHAKGYIFNHGDYYSLIVGSSNLTAQALKVNYEWNVKLTSHEDGEVIHHFKNQFEDVWEAAQPLNDEWVYQYEKTYQPLDFNAADRVVEMPAEYNTNSIKDALEIKPNKMQQDALQQIQAVREAGHQKGLVISATGTGKTYLSAFDVRRFAPKKTLFIVHREQILNKAKMDFQRVLGGRDIDYGILSGSSKQTDAKYLFATIQTISKEENLNHFDPEEFDYILIDEVHKAGATSYQRVIDYFNPVFLMGMTATPERTDDFNIYELFDYHIAYEIRLQEALEENMLTPFHYFGVTDLEYNGEVIDDATILSNLVTEDRVNHIIEKVDYYGFSGERVKGLIFCSKKEEAKRLSVALNNKGYRTVALTGDNAQEERIQQVNRLENGALDYILTVDIFNEGIDIPSINQVVMLRQTQSSIVFIQQLGRGLRKHDSKDFVTVIDFIGNYKNNYLIPVALSGDKSQNKDNIRRRTLETSYIKGVSTINFEEIAKKQIFKSINNSNLTAMKILKEAFVELKNRIGKTPYMYDFVTNNSIDPVVITGKHKNYHQFLIKMKEEVSSITDYENRVLTMLSSEVLNGKRKHELILLELLLQRGAVDHDEYLDHLSEAKCRIDDATIQSVGRVLDLSFFTQPDQVKYGEEAIVTKQEDNTYVFNGKIKEKLNSNEHFNHMIKDILLTARKKSEKYQCSQQLTLYEKYSRKDACKLLNWDSDESSTMYGYKPKHQTCPIFVTYHKNSEVESSVNYGDELLSPDVFKWYTRSNRTLKSAEVKKIIHAEENNIDLHFFTKKDDDEGSGFYYLGQVLPDKNTVQQDTMEDKEGKEIPVVHMNMVMEQPVNNKLYHYIVDGKHDN